MLVSCLLTNCDFFNYRKFTKNEFFTYQIKLFLPNAIDKNGDSFFTFFQQPRHASPFVMKNFLKDFSGGAAIIFNIIFSDFAAFVE